MLQGPAAIQAELGHTTQKLDGTNQDDDEISKAKRDSIDKALGH